jgi:NTE family protein
LSGRWGLVLGGGGVLGGAWMVGALTALQEEVGLDPRDAELIVGTSAGSVTAALLGAGVSVPELRSHQLGEPVGSGPLAALDWDYKPRRVARCRGRRNAWCPRASPWSPGT